jgi:hypothetical protein
MLLTTELFSVYRIETILLLYSIIIGFSFDIFRKDRMVPFQYFAGVAVILYLVGRMFSLWTQFTHKPETYNEMFFFLDIFLMIFFYRSLAKIALVNKPDFIKINSYQEIWICFTITMGMTTIYRMLYAGLEWYNITQSIAVCYCLGGFFLTKWLAKKDAGVKWIDKIQLAYSIPFFLGSLGYCIMRFRVQDF